LPFSNIALSRLLVAMIWVLRRYSASAVRDAKLWIT